MADETFAPMVNETIVVDTSAPYNPTWFDIRIDPELGESVEVTTYEHRCGDILTASTYLHLHEHMWHGEEGGWPHDPIYADQVEAIFLTAVIAYYERQGWKLEGFAFSSPESIMHEGKLKQVDYRELKVVFRKVKTT